MPPLHPYFKEASMADALLYERWFSLMARLKVPVECLDQAAKIFQNLYDAYSHKLRAYHNLGHIIMCLNELHNFRVWSGNHWGSEHSSCSAEFALWWHDFSDNNEKLSAERAADSLNLLGLGHMSNKVSELIIATDHKDYRVLSRAERVDPNDADLVCDIDLAILGQQKEIFDSYEKGVRQEYINVPESLFREKRAEILQKFLDRPRIYRTDYFYGEFEELARENLKRSVKRLIGD